MSLYLFRTNHGDLRKTYDQFLKPPDELHIVAEAYDMFPLDLIDMPRANC